ncbi:DNA topoisomerase (ATP-hydrolyzing) subunit B [Candidatus Micrarchaeota archaeon]|nr:DNA topoisomerase (ATP-hydrolyzing) subunit B [Candidatus Micrarchaeota archaeon]
MEDYGASTIKVLEGLEGVRKRPAMYIGDTGKHGLHHMIYEIMDNSIDEAMAGYCKNIEVILKTDNSIFMRDDGRGIPVGIHPKYKKSALEIVTTMLHAGGKFEKKAYKVSGGLHGVGLSVVNALSERMEIEVHRDGKIHVQKYEKGKSTTPVEVKGDSNYTGTIVRFKPDLSIFPSIEFDFNSLAERFREIAFLNKGLRIILDDEKMEKREEFFSEGGLSEFILFINKSRTPFHIPIVADKVDGDVIMEYGVQYTDYYSTSLYSFVNNIKTTEGGTHVSGFRTALLRSINEYAKSNNLMKEKDRRFVQDDIQEGLTALISVKIPSPQFEGQTKTKLGNPEVKSAVEKFVYSSFKSYLEEHPKEAQLVISKIARAMKAREAAQKARDLIRRKSVFESSVLPGKLADCIENDPTKAEIFIVEGDSAGGSAKQGRDRNTQAILPLRGKILNVEKAPLTKLLANEEIKSMILAFGTGFGEEFNLSKLRYHKIVIMTDADVDGSHIRTLLLTLLYRHFNKVIEDGYVYIAQPPLYKVKKGKTEKYAFNDQELAVCIEEMGESASIQRYKGLGEMNPEQLWETTMNPETRTLKRVTIEDAMKADKLFSVLMGDAVEPRREFISAHAKEVMNLDV